MEFGFLAPDPQLLAVAVVLDLLFGDPVYRAHPVRLIGNSLTAIEKKLWQQGWSGYAGGVGLFLLLAVFWLAAGVAVLWAATGFSDTLAAVVHAFFIFSLIALGDLWKHAKRVDDAVAAGDLNEARVGISMLVGRDTTTMDGAACRRAAMESMAENAVDGFISPIFWYALLGLPGLILFKVISTMDSMVGYKTERYFKFGWCGARLDDWANYLPARLSYGLMVLLAALLPGFSGSKAAKIGWRQHALLLGPNAGWSEATLAGAVQRRLIGPIYADGKLVTELWIGDEQDPAAGDDHDVRRAAFFIGLLCILCVVGAYVALSLGG